MYEEYFRLKGLPFQLSPDPTYYYSSDGHRRALSYLKYGVYQGEGFVVVTGEIGAGKTTLVRTLIGELDASKIVAAQLVSTQLGASDVLRSVLATFGLPVKGSGKAEMLHTIEAFLTSLFIEGKRAILIVDEAQNLPADAIEELRMLSNFQIQDRGLLQSLLVGQPELREMLRSTRHEQLRQRIIASYHLGAMSVEDTRGYIQHRLSCVGWQSDPEFDADAFEAIFRFSGGVPRKINRLCNRLLLSTYLAGGHRVTADDVAEVAREIGEEIGADLVSVHTPKKTRSAQALIAGEQPKSHEPDSSEQAPSSGALASEKLAEVIAAERSKGNGGPSKSWDLRTGSILCVGDSIETVAMLGQLCRSLTRLRVTPAPGLIFLSESESNDANDLLVEAGLLKPNVVLHAGATREDVLPLSNQIADMEQLLSTYRPALVVTAGDSDAMLMVAVTARRAGVPLARVDAGLRVFGHSASSDVNRIAIDSLSSVLFASEVAAVKNLERESFSPSRIEFVGNLLIDAIVIALPKGKGNSDLLKSHQIPLSLVTNPRGYALAEIQWTHEASDMFAELADILIDISEVLPVLWLANSTTQQHLEKLNALARADSSRLAIMARPDYFERIRLVSEATVVLTASCELQTEATALGVPCLTFADKTMRPVTVETGTNVLAKIDRTAAKQAVEAAVDGANQTSRIPERWDGKTAGRIALSLAQWAKVNRAAPSRARA